MERITIQIPDRFQCLNCKAIAGALNGLQKRDLDTQDDGVHLRRSQDYCGTLDTLRRANQSSTCMSVCAKLVQLLNKMYGKVTDHDYQRTVYVGGIYGRFTLGLNPYPSDGPCFEFVPVGSWCSFRDFGIEVDPHWIDISRLRNWIEHCNAMHVGICHHLPTWQQIPHCRRLILIDVERHCLVETHDVPSYYALSYVWGRQPSLTTTKSNFRALCEPGILENEQWKLQIPRTIRDAIHLTSSLGSGFLWVDRLCIIQDDEKSKTQWIGAMSSVYANAYMTIVASGGADADHGLLGVGGGSHQRSYDQFQCQFTPDCRILGTGHFGHRRKEEEYFRRGWTFQEELLSSRTLIFEANSAFWSCMAMNRQEDIDREKPEAIYAASHGAGKFAISPSRGPRLDEYARFVGAYSKRNLSFPEDRLRAFAGVLGALCGRFKEGFHFGLPEDFFDVSLLWKSTCDACRISGPADKTQGISQLPSWSWAGWSGAVELSMCVHTPRYLQSGWKENLPHVPLGLHIHRIVRWYKKRVNSESRVPISNSFYEWRDLSENVSAKVPEEWYKVALPFNLTEYDTPIPTRSQGSAVLEEPLSYVFRHESHLNCTYRHMVPLVKDESRALLADEEWQPFLFSSAQSSRFQTTELDNNIHQMLGKSMFEPYRSAFLQNHLSIVDGSGKLVGILQSGTNTDGNQTRQQSVELIAISRMTIAPRDFQTAKYAFLPELNFRGFFLAPDGVYDFYNVLSIKWEDRIAYRTGIGRVSKAAWESSSCKQVEVVLG